MPAFYDEFNIDEQYQLIKKLAIKLEKDIYKFISPTKNKQAAMRARKALGEIRTISLKLRKSISKQRNHNNSKYD